MSGSGKPRVAIAGTGAANLASVEALCLRAGVAAQVSDRAEDIAAADYAILPGVGSFGAAMERLSARGLDVAFRERVAQGRPSMGICLGMQMFCLASEESPGVAGIGVVPARIGKFGNSLPLPQLGWNRVGTGTGAVADASRSRFVKPGWAYFANSYRLAEPPPGFGAAWGVYGETFVAALEYYADPGAARPSLLLCQFHPELSGPWGLDLFSRWIGVKSEEGAA